jgi:hypothetical protein
MALLISGKRNGLLVFDPIKRWEVSTVSVAIHLTLAECAILAGENEMPEDARSAAKSTRTEFSGGTGEPR